MSESKTELVKLRDELREARKSLAAAEQAIEPLRQKIDRLESHIALLESRAVEWVHKGPTLPARICRCCGLGAFEDQGRSACCGAML